MRVLVCDDHAMVRAGLEALIDSAPDMELAGTARDGAEAVAACTEAGADVVLMDLVMPGLDGLAATRRIAALRPGCHVLVLTAFCDRDRVVAALRAGAAGYLVKDTPPAELLDAIRATYRGERRLGPAAAEEVVADLTGPPSRLTPREREVLGLLARGLSNKVIAGRLGVSHGTVKATLTSIFRRIGVHNRTDAALWAQRHQREISRSASDDEEGHRRGGADHRRGG